jgi:hypothetical protein
VTRGTGMTGCHAPVAMTTTWLTPPHVLEALGDFDLDPCAAPEPRPWPTAKRHIALPSDGLSAAWEGRIWLNPPYGRETAEWLHRLAQHGNGIALIFARTETDMFFKHVWQRAQALLFLRGRITFRLPDGVDPRKNSGAPSVLIAYGEENAACLRSCNLRGQFVRPNRNRSEAA